MGDMCVEYFVLKKATQSEIKEQDEDGLAPPFVFNNSVYVIDAESSQHNVVMTSGDYSALTDDGKLIFAFSFYDGGCDLFEALENVIKQFEAKFNQNKHRLADDLKHLI